MSSTESLRATGQMAAIETPCVKVCVVEPASGLCTGCGRTLAEIGEWIRYSDETRRRIMAELPARLACLQACGVSKGA